MYNYEKIGEYMPINREILTKNLINIRKQHKLTQTDIASQLGITQQAYAK
jgi:DNA-binding XRE family transcriptional regulator